MLAIKNIVNMLKQLIWLMLLTYSDVTVWFLCVINNFLCVVFTETLALVISVCFILFANKVGNHRYCEYPNIANVANVANV